MVTVYLILSIFLSFNTLANAADIVKGPKGERYGTGLLRIPESYQGYGKSFVTIDDCENLPENFDLRDFGVVPDVKNQGSCGSCWSFSKTASLESAVRANGGPSLDLSEQELVSCDRNNYGCNGGLLNQNEYQIAKGQALEKDFPYTGRNSSCKSGLAPVAKGLKFVHVPTDEKQIKCALFKSHTIPWITAAANGWGSAPRDSNTPFTSCGSRSLNHAIGLVGWKTIGGKSYYIVRNSWGTNWGAGGYALMPHGCSLLGKDEIAYIMTNEMPCKPPQKVKLAIEMLANMGDTIMLAVPPEEGVSYQWFKGDVKIGEGLTAPILVSDLEADYKVLGKNSCGSGESKTKVKALQAVEN